MAARALDITLTSRQKGDGAIPMAGVPHHAVEGYIARLIRTGHKVALCDQVEAAAAKGRKLIRREVVRLVTPGTVTDTGLLDGRQNNFLAALAPAGGPGDRLGVALVDVTTADFWVGEADDAAALVEAVLLRRPAELLVPATHGARGSAARALPGDRHHRDDARRGRLRPAGRRGAAAGPLPGGGRRRTRPRRPARRRPRGRRGAGLSARDPAGAALAPHAPPAADAGRPPRPGRDGRAQPRAGGEPARPHGARLAPVGARPDAHPDGRTPAAAVGPPAAPRRRARSTAGSPPSRP